MFFCHFVELDTAEGDSAMKSEGNQSNPNLLDLANSQEIGRVSSWAVSFDHLLQDELGLACFTVGVPVYSLEHQTSKLT